MGGNAFSDVVSITKEDINDFKQQVKKSVLSELGIIDFCFVGSCQEEKECGDIDVAINLSTHYSNDQKQALFYMSKLLFNEENVKIIGSAVCLRLIHKKTGKVHQVDLFPCDNVSDAKWLMNGLFRHMLFALIAKEESEMMSTETYKTKITLAVPDGLQVIVNDKTIILDRTADPSTMLLFLGFRYDISPADVETLQSLANEVAVTRPEILQKYESYVSHLKDKKEYATSVQIVKEALMNAIVNKCATKAP